MNTADLSDEFPDLVKVAEPLFRDFGGLKKFQGTIHTLKVFEDNTLVRKALEQNGENKVLVIDGGGSLRCALLGGNLGVLAVKNKWSGIVIYGCVRDSAELKDLQLGVRALNSNPRKSVKRNEGQEQIKINFAGVDFVPGHFLLADEDGIIVREKINEEKLPAL